MSNKNNSTILFKQKKVRRHWDENEEEWFFSIIDVIAVLTDSPRPRKYWNALKTKLMKEGSELSQKVGQLKLESSDGKKYLTDVMNTKVLLRLIQSIPSPKAEPFKLWLAKVGYERIQEIDDPELATKRARDLYKAKGYSDAWIEKRMRGIEVHATLTSEWDKREIKEPVEYAILTAEISKATFGMTPSQYKKHKGLKRENLRDHMDDLELIFSMLGEASTTEIVRAENPQGFVENKKVAKKGGSVAGKARKDLEEKTGQKVSIKKNYLGLKAKNEGDVELGAG